MTTMFRISLTTPITAYYGHGLYIMYILLNDTVGGTGFPILKSVHTYDDNLRPTSTPQLCFI